MGYVISYESLRDMYDQISLVMDSIMNERIPKINEILLEYINEEKIQGKTADTIKKYLGETHGTILQGIYDVSQQFLINFRLYQNGYYSIDSNRDTVIDENYVNFIDETVKDFVQKESDITSECIKETAAISDIFTANVPSDWNIKSISDTIKRKNEELNNDIIEYERMQKNALADVEELICSLKTAIESAKKGVGSFNSPMVDLAIVTENIEKIRQFQNDNKAEINSAFSNQDAILEEIWTEEQAKIRQEQGLWECVAGVTTVVLGGAAIILSGGAAIPIVLGVATIAFGSSDIIEGTQDVYYGSVGDISSKSFNPLRDTLFFGNQRAYDIAESIVTFAAGSSIPIANAAKAGNVLTSTQKAKIVVSELGKEVIGTGGGFLGVKLGEGLGLSKEESMFLGMAGSIVTSKGADWVDNNWDNLVLAGKYTFSNSGKSVSLGSNGGNVVNDFRETFNKVKASEVLDVDEVKKVEKVTNDVRKTGVGKTGEGIPLEEVKPGVLKQIYPNDNGAYGYLPNEGSAYYKPEYDFTDVDWAKEMQDVRKDYLEASKQLEIDIERMTSEGFSKEDIAKHVVGERNQQKVTARANMTLEERAGLEERNIELYGNPVGPDAQWLFSKTKKKLLKEGTYIDDNQIWEIIIKKSMVKDDVINTLLGLIH